MSAAARRLRVAQPTVSRRLVELEAQLGEALFLRSVEGAPLAGFGERLLEPARRMAEWATEFERAAKNETALQRRRAHHRATGAAFEFLRAVRALHACAVARGAARGGLDRALPRPDAT